MHSFAHTHKYAIAIKMRTKHSHKMWTNKPSKIWHFIISFTNNHHKVFMRSPVGNEWMLHTPSKWKLNFPLHIMTDLSQQKTKNMLPEKQPCACEVHACNITQWGLNQCTEIKNNRSPLTVTLDGCNALVHWKSESHSKKSDCSQARKKQDLPLDTTDLTMTKVERSTIALRVTCYDK